ncbi:MAG: hypothetical protein HEP71_30160 [Roseivirga sp.]|nr:hypothetical protein [Roseivirga sp.]
MDKLLAYIRRSLERKIYDLVFQEKKRPKDAPDPLKAKVENHFFHRLSGRKGNLYTNWGIPQTHNAWDMQYLLDDGRLFYLYACAKKYFEFLNVGFDKFQFGIFSQDMLMPIAETAFADLDIFYKQQYKKYIESKIPEPEYNKYLWECVQYEIIQAYIQWACKIDKAYLTLDLFPTSVADAAGDAKDKHQRFSTSGYESYSRVYTVKLCQLLQQKDASGFTFSLVVPYTNTVPNINRTNALPMDGVENTVHYLQDICVRHEGIGLKNVYVMGYSQAGAVVKLLNDFLCKPYILTRYKDYLYNTVARDLLTAQKTYPYITKGVNMLKSRLSVNTISLAPMGGLTVCSTTKEVKTGCLTKFNNVNGRHLSICHALDPVKVVIPKKEGYVNYAHFYANLIHFKKSEAGLLHGLLLSSIPKGSQQTFAEALTGNNLNHLNTLLTDVAFVVNKLNYHNKFLEETGEISELKKTSFELAHLGIFGYPMYEVARVLKLFFIDGYTLFGISDWNHDIYPVSDSDTDIFKDIDRNSPFA